jgi:hypothetical protein
MKGTSLLVTAAALLAVYALPAAAATGISSNPDTPTVLKTNTIVGNMDQGDGKSFDNYYSIQAGPGTVKVRVTLRAGSDAGQVAVGLTDQDGNQLAPATCGAQCNYNNVIANGQGDATTTGTFQLADKRTLVVHVRGSAQYYHAGPHPSYRIQFDGDVSLDKTAAPLKIANRPQ